MIAIHRHRNKEAKWRYWVTVTGANNEIVSVSETFTRKANAVKNIIAQAHAYDARKIWVVDKTVIKRGYTTHLQIKLRCRGRKLIRVETEIVKLSNSR